MTRLPRLKGKELLRILERAGFRIIRTKGSHTFVRHEDGRATVVPVHAGETIGPGLLRAILRDVEMTANDLREYS
jgi:predicted RNA binding protein YcfA (HicA-like mRNA interferase family)